MRAVWAEERDLADRATLLAIAASRTRTAQPCWRRRRIRRCRPTYEANTEAAIAAGVFGVPTFVIGDELFWGQDRLDFVARALQ